MTSFKYLSLAVSVLLLASVYQSLQVRVHAPEVTQTLQQLKDRNNLKLSINSADRYLYADHKNVFTIPPLISARNMVQVISNIYLYPILMIDQRPNQERKYNLLHPVTRQVLKSVQQPIILSPIQKINYFDSQGGFSFKSVIFSGYGLMIIFGVLLYFCYQQIMPKLEEAQAAPQS